MVDHLKCALYTTVNDSKADIILYRGWIFYNSTGASMPLIHTNLSDN